MNDMVAVAERLLFLAEESDGENLLRYIQSLPQPVPGLALNAVEYPGVLGRLVSCEVPVGNISLLVNAGVLPSPQESNALWNALMMEIEKVTSHEEGAPGKLQEINALALSLIKKGIGLEAATQNLQESVVHKAARLGRSHPQMALQWFEALRKAGFPLDQGDSSGYTPALVACWRHAPEALAYLIGCGADLGRITKGDRTAASLIFWDAQEDDSPLQKQRAYACLCLLQENNQVDMAALSEKEKRLLAHWQGEHLHNALSRNPPSSRSRF